VGICVDLSLNQSNCKSLFLWCNICTTDLQRSCNLEVVLIQSGVTGLRIRPGNKLISLLVIQAPHPL